MKLDDDYESKKSAMLKALRRLGKLDSGAKERLGKIAHSLETDAFTMAVLGQFKRGKSTLVNAILGEPLLPVAVLPLTSVITVVTQGKKLAVKVVYQNGEARNIGKNEIAEYVTENGNPKNIKGIERVEISLPSDFLSKGITLVDTPGIGSVYHHNTDIAYQFLPDIDAALFVISADPPISDAECKFLEESAKYASKFFFVLNKMDYVDAAEMKELLDFSKDIISQKTGNAYADTPVLPLSAKRALAARVGGDAVGLQRSGLPGLEREVERFVVSEKGAFILRSCQSKMLAVAQELINHRLIEKKALEVSQKELEERSKRFEAELEGILSHKDYSGEMVEVEQKKILEVIDTDLVGLKARAIPELTEKIIGYAKALPKGSNDTFAAAIDDYRQETVLHVLEHWRNEEEGRVSGLFSEKMRKYSAEVDNTIDRIEKLACDLFEVEIKNRRTEERLTLESMFYFKLSRVDEISTLSGLTLSRLELLLPHNLFRKKLISGISEEVTKDLDRNAGRMRYDFLERMQKSALDFKWALDEKIDAVVAGIRDANGRALKIKAVGSNKANKRASELEQEIAELENILEAVNRL